MVSRPGKLRSHGVGSHSRADSHTGCPCYGGRSVAGRTQGRGTYHGSVDAVRRTAQREVYADLYRATRRFIDAQDLVYNTLTHEHSLSVALDDLAPALRALVEEMHDSLDAVEDAADMVRLEGPERLAEIADGIVEVAQVLGGQRAFGWPQRRLWPPDNAGLILLVEMERLHSTQDDLLREARKYLNGGPSR